MIKFKRLLGTFFVSIISLVGQESQQTKTVPENQRIIENKLKEMNTNTKLIDKKVMYNGIIQAQTHETEEAEDVYKASRKIASTLDQKSILILKNEPITLKKNKSIKKKKNPSAE